MTPHNVIPRSPGVWCTIGVNPPTTSIAPRSGESVCSAAPSILKYPDAHWSARRHCEQPTFARSASYGGFVVRRSAEREGGSEAIQPFPSPARGEDLGAFLDCFVALRAPRNDR